MYTFVLLYTRTYIYRNDKLIFHVIKKYHSDLDISMFNLEKFEYVTPMHK